MIGYSGSFAVDGVDFILQPTSMSYDGRTNYGFDGNGHPVYPSVRNVEIKWALMHPNDAQQIIAAYNTQQNTGTVVFDLPDYGNTSYLFKSYSGCTIEEPEFGEYFMGYIKDGKLMIHNVRT